MLIGKPVLLVILGCAAWATTGAVACLAAEPSYSPVPSVMADWQSSETLPRQFRNHCGVTNGHYYCGNHCGAGYQFYYCSAAAFGCCLTGSGYCDHRGNLRCSPSFPWPF